MKKLQDLNASEFRGIDPIKFEAWRQAELSFAQAHRSIIEESVRFYTEGLGFREGVGATEWYIVEYEGGSVDKVVRTMEVPKTLGKA